MKKIKEIVEKKLRDPLDDVGYSKEQILAYKDGVRHLYRDICDMEKRKKHKEIHKDFAGIELPEEKELRIFCVFRNTESGKWRLVQSDAVFSNLVANELTYKELLVTLKSIGISHGELLK